MDIADGDEDEAAALEAAMAMSMEGAAAVLAPRKSQSRSFPSGEVATQSSLCSTVSTGRLFYRSWHRETISL